MKATSEGESKILSVMIINTTAANCILALEGGLGDKNIYEKGEIVSLAKLIH